MDPWYAKGIRFRCEGAACGNCCTGGNGAGHVWVTVAEMQELARHLGLPFDAFTRRYVRRVGDRFSLVETAAHDCVFHRPGAGCRVYEARPLQCRTYPFWPKLLASRRRFKAQERVCPGIGAGGPEDLHDQERVEGLMRRQPAAPAAARGREGGRRVT